MCSQAMAIARNLSMGTVFHTLSAGDEKDKFYAEL